MTTILAQHGTAKGQKMNIAYENGTINGCIFSPREENFDSISHYIDNSMIFEPNNIFLDPQLYYSTFDGNILKHLENYADYPQHISRRDWRKRTQNLMNYLNQHIDNTADISDYLITPGFYIQALDWKFDYSIDIYNYCHEETEFEKYYLSLFIQYSFFHSKSDVDEMLEDIADNVDNRDGIYFTICHDENTENNYEYMDSQNLTNILYFVYSLKNMGFDIMVGYTFMNSILFAMLDCEYVATGWFNNLRQFKTDRFEETENTGRRKKRYTSIPLLTYVTFEMLNILEDFDFDLDDYLSHTHIDSKMYDTQETISFVDLEQQYWEALHILFEQINQYDSIPERIHFVLNKINTAKNNYDTILDALSEDRVIYNKIKTASKHLDVWIMAIDTFKQRISLID